MQDSERQDYLRNRPFLHLLGVGIADDDKCVNALSDSLAVCYEGVEFVVSTDEARAQSYFRSNIIVDNQDMLFPVFLVPEELRSETQRQLLPKPVTYMFSSS